MRVETIGNATLYLGDCLEVLPMLCGLGDGCQNPDVSVEQGRGAGNDLKTRIDAIITDPQYGVGIDYEGHGDALRDVMAHTLRFVQIATAAARVVAFTAGKWETELALYQQFPPRWRMVWYKGAQSTASPIGFNDWEAVMVYGEKVHNNAHDYFYAQPEPMGNHGHPCPKPVRYSEILIGRLSKPGGLICDPFLGSGSAGVAAYNAGRPFVGIELEPKFFDIRVRAYRKRPPPRKAIRMKCEHCGRTQPEGLRKDLKALLEAHKEAEADGAALHELGRSDGDYYTDDHAHAAENLHLSSRERDRLMRQFLTKHADDLMRCAMNECERKP